MSNFQEVRLSRDVFEFPSKRSNHHFPLPLGETGERRIKGELSQNQNNSIDRVAYYKRDEYFYALGCQNISCHERESIVKGSPFFMFVYHKIISLVLLVSLAYKYDDSVENDPNFNEINDVFLNTLGERTHNRWRSILFTPSLFVFIHLS